MVAAEFAVVVVAAVAAVVDVAAVVETEQVAAEILLQYLHRSRSSIEKVLAYFMMVKHVMESENWFWVFITLS